MIKADRLLAERLQAREQEELTDEEKARLFVELLEKRKKHFAALRAQEKKNKPPTKAQKKSTMLTYLKHMADYRQKESNMEEFLQGKNVLLLELYDFLVEYLCEVFEEDGISLIATFIGKPIMLDSYTSSMCNESWARSSFARCLIKVNSEADLVDVVTIRIPSLTWDDFTKETIYVEYEWRPPRCDTCKIFGHVHDNYPKKVATHPIVVTSNVVTPTVEKTNDGFQTVGKKKKKKGKSKSNNHGQSVGPSVKQNVSYEPNAPTSASKKGDSIVGNATNSSSLLKNIEDEEEEEHVENVYDETANLFPKIKTGGVSYFTAAVGWWMPRMPVGVDCQEYQEIELLEDESCWRWGMGMYEMVALDNTSGVVGVVTRVVAATLAEAIACFDLWVSSKTILERAS
ncbi:zinc knuckle CX2CX4HX4C containing protein [Tanacetum coccineum]